MNNRIQNYLIIPVALLLAHVPVLFGHYIRQDDMGWQVWVGMLPSERYDYYHVLVELFRPMSFPFILLTDKMTYLMSDAVWIRLTNIICVSVSACLLYYWQTRFSRNTILSLAFAIAAFTLPSFQVFTATANYLLILISLIEAELALITMWWAVSNPGKSIGLVISILLYLTSLLDYPLASMFVWAMLFIAYLSVRFDNATTNLAGYHKRFLIISLFLLTTMFAYFFLGKVVQHYIVVPHPYGSHLHMNFNLGNAISFYFSTMVWHSHFWFWRSASLEFWPNVQSSIPLLAIVLLFCTALYTSAKRKSCGLAATILENLFILAFALALAYLPILLSSEFNVNFRYSMTTMPILLYVVFWSIQQLAPIIIGRKMTVIIFSMLAIVAVLLSNTFLERNIVGPQDHDFTYLQQRIQKDVLPSIKQHEPITIAIRSYVGPARFFEYNAPGFEYGMRISQYEGQGISAVVHVLRELGVESATWGHRNEEVTTPEADIATVPWGIVMNINKDLTDEQIIAEAKKISPNPVVIIDLPDAEQYKKFSLYTQYL